jgi:hypothetical protein
MVVGAKAQLLSALLLTLSTGAAAAAPPAGKEWVPSLSSEFTDAALSSGRWSPLDRPASALESARAAANVVAGDGGLRLTSRLVDKDGWHWTTALLSVPGSRQTYGYFEARIRIAGATGLSNRFALVGGASPGDVAIGLEGHYPDTLVMSLRGVPQPVMQRIRARGIDLSVAFHRYAIELLPNDHGSTTISWYFDDLRLGSTDCTVCAVPMTPEFSTSISTNAKLAGPATVALDGQSMDLLALRVYQAKDLGGRPPAPAEANAVERNAAPPPGS